MSALVDGALEWAAAGVPVFPCGAKKQPLEKGGFKNAVTDPDEVRDLFEKFGNSAKMVGARMGEESGLFALDFDLYKGDSPREYYEMLVESGLLPPTRVHETKSGGLHVIYEHDSQWPNVQPVDGVEIKGEGGYIIVPPSKGYKEISSGVTEAPKALIKMLTKARAKAAAATTTELRMKVMAGEGFHDNLRAIIARESARGVDPVQIMSDLKNLMESSVASDVSHERHDRWAAMMADSGKEFTRMVTTGYEKYNSNAATEQYKEQVGDKHEVNKAIASSAGFVENRSTPEGKTEVKQVEDYGDSWPFEGSGYFASEDHDLLNQKYIMHPFFAEDETTVLFAEPKMGKTAWNVTASLHIACGMDMGPSLKVVEARPCLYYALEGSRAIKLRIAAWRKEMEEQNVELPEQIPLFVVERPQNFLKEDARIEACNQIIASDLYCKKHLGVGLGLISLDTLTKAMSSGDQNSVEDTSALFDLVGLLREGGVTASIVFVHHKARTGGVRGSTNIEAEPDVLLDVSKGKLDKTDLEVRVARARSIDEGGVYTFSTKTIPLGTTAQGIDLTSFVVLPKDDVEVDQESLIGSQTSAKILGVIRAMGTGVYPLLAVYAALNEAGLAPEVGGKRSRKPSMKGSLMQEFFLKYVGNTGCVFQGTGISLQRNASELITGIKVQ